MGKVTAASQKHYATVTFLAYIIPKAPDFFVPFLEQRPDKTLIGQDVPFQSRLPDEGRKLLRKKASSPTAFTYKTTTPTIFCTLPKNNSHGVQERDQYASHFFSLNDTYTL